jgi:hypothetical protein
VEKSCTWHHHSDLLFGNGGTFNSKTLILQPPIHVLGYNKRDLNSCSIWLPFTHKCIGMDVRIGGFTFELAFNNCCSTSHDYCWSDNIQKSVGLQENSLLWGLISHGFNGKFDSICNI